MIRSILVALVLGLCTVNLMADESRYAPWKFGPPKDDTFFPIGVWLQGPHNAERFKAAGMNTYVGLHKGPTEEQLAKLKQVGMYVICDQNEVGLKHKDDPNIIAWLLPDEPDNAQPRTDGQPGWGPRVEPAEVVKWYEKAKAADPSRPVMLNLGFGVADDKWIGRGEAAKKEDYLTYVKAADIVSFDIYPVAGLGKRDKEPQLWFVGEGVSRLIKWTEGKKPIYAFIECTGYDGPEHVATPQEVKAQVWIAITHGANGIMWFVHQFKPNFIEAGLLAYPEMTKAVTAINKELTSLAPVLNSPAVADGAKVKSSDEKIKLSVQTKKHGGATYVFAVPEFRGETKASFEVPGLPEKATAEVIGEDRKIDVVNGKFEDTFEEWAVHLYRIK